VWTTAIIKPEDFVLGLGAFALLMFWRCPPWIVVALTGGIGALLVQFNW
jgi:chromate transporter